MSSFQEKYHSGEKIGKQEIIDEIVAILDSLTWKNVELNKRVETVRLQLQWTSPWETDDE